MPANNFARSEGRGLEARQMAIGAKVGTLSRRLIWCPLPSRPDTPWTPLHCLFEAPKLRDSKFDHNKRGVVAELHTVYRLRKPRSMSLALSRFSTCRPDLHYPVD